jgi:hypothetical protein
LRNVREGNLTEQPIYWPVQVLERIIKARAMRKQPTIITSRVSRDTLARAFPDLAAELYGWLEIPCSMQDIRAQGSSSMSKEFGFDEAK